MSAPRVLLVDDQRSNVRALEAMLDGLDAHFVAAHSGEETLRHLLEEEFALILLDVRMPGLDGFETAALIRDREVTRATPIIFLTALDDDAAQLAEGYARGAVDYLVKPVDPHVLRSKVSVFLELHRAKERIRDQEAELRRREKEAWRRETQRRHRNLSDAMPICIWASEPDGTIDYFNRAWTAFCGTMPVRAKQDDIIALAHPHDTARIREGRTRGFLRGNDFELTYRLRRHDGVYRTFLERVIPERDAEGDVIGWVGTATDIEDLKRASEDKDAFLAAAGHELRAPLAAAQAILRLAIKRLDAGREAHAEESLRKAFAQVERMSKLVEDLLDVTRLERGPLPLDRSEVDIIALVREVSDRMRETAGERVFELRGPSTLVIEADRSRVDQVLTNLIGNAIRYSPDGSKVSVELASEGDQIGIAVRDRGVGIAKEHQEKIFQRFGRVHGARFGGLGLGLTIAHGIVEQHGGHISVESTGVPGEGTTFRVVLPRRAKISATPISPRPGPAASA